MSRKLLRYVKDAGRLWEKGLHIFLLSLLNELSSPPRPLVLAKLELWKHFPGLLYSLERKLNLA